MALALTALLALVILVAGNPLEQIEREGLDWALRGRAWLGWTPAADSRIAILGIDDTDMATLPDLTAEYRAVAEAIAQASDLGAAVIMLDVISARGTPEMAAPILAAVANGPPVVFAEVWRTAAGTKRPARRVRSFPFRPEPMAPAGLVNIDVDADGVQRSSALLWPGEGGSEPALALAAYFALRGVDWETEVRQPRPGVIQWNEISSGSTNSVSRELAEDARVARLLNFRGSWGAGAGFFHLNLRGLRDLHATHAAPGGQPLAGKVILIGNTATGIADLGTTSFGPNQPHVLLHATALNDLVQDTAMRRTGRWADALALLAVLPLLAAAGWCRSKRHLLLLWLAGIAGILTAGFVLIFQCGWVAATAALWTAAVIVELGRRHTMELAARQRLRDTIGQYFSPRVLNDVLENPGRLEPRRVEIAALLTDLRNSTPLAELLGADGMLALLRRH